MLECIFFTPKECFNPNAIFYLDCYTCLLKSQKFSETSMCLEFFYLCVCIGTWTAQLNLSNYTKSDKNRTCHFGGNFYPNALEFVNNPITKTQTWNVYQKQWPTFDAWAQEKKKKENYTFKMLSESQSRHHVTFFTLMWPVGKTWLGRSGWSPLKISTWV